MHIGITDFQSLSINELKRKEVDVQGSSAEVQPYSGWASNWDHPQDDLLSTQNQICGRGEEMSENLITNLILVRP